jgi:general stress protein 26
VKIFPRHYAFSVELLLEWKLNNLPKETIMGDIKNLVNEAAIKKIQQLAMDADIAVFATNILAIPATTRPMSTQDVDEDGNLWFMSRIDSNKNKEIGRDNRVQLYYSNISNSEYLTIYGHAEIILDRDKIEALWTPIAKAWFTEGKDDPSISLIKVQPIAAYYWDTKENKVVALLKTAISAITGKENDGGVEGSITIKNSI